MPEEHVKIALRPASVRRPAEIYARGTTVADTPWDMAFCGGPGFQEIVEHRTQKVRIGDYCLPQPQPEAADTRTCGHVFASSRIALARRICVPQ